MKISLYDIETSKDNISRKVRILLEDGYIIELMLVERPEKNIICFPSQIGCCLSCIFCKSKNLVRNLYPCEVKASIDIVKEQITDKNKSLLLSCMGEGEPSLNKYIVDIFKEIYDSSDKLALATTGIYTPIFVFMNEFKDKLKIMLSLHASNIDARIFMLRNSMGINYLMDEFRKYEGKKEINYVLINYINDSYTDCIRLRKLCGNIPVKINKYNKTVSYIKESKKIKRFIYLYRSMFGKIEYYETDGADIKGACGMMSHNLR